MIKEVDEVFESIPAISNEDKVEELLGKELSSFKQKIIVLDDDPTGVQTVHDVSVYTDWSEEAIRQGFSESNKMFFILTNSRSFTVKETKQVHQEIATRICKISQETGKKFVIISRSDSTLRGHYPLETETMANVLKDKLGLQIDGEVIMPFFKEGGRFTIDNVHYVQVGDKLVPAGETEFAKDKTFGYQQSDLTQWVKEKTNGKYLAENVVTISLEDLRKLNIDKIVGQLLEVEDFNKVVVNAVDYFDVKVFVIALMRAFAKGKYFIFRSAAALTKVMGGVTDRPLLTKKELVDENDINGGLIIVGSHVKKTTAQLDKLQTLENLAFIEFNVASTLNSNELAKEKERVYKLVNTKVAAGQTVVVYTSRKVIDVQGDKEKSLLLSVGVSDALTSIVKQLPVKPRFILAKGGITSSDVGVKGLGVKRALVAGQVRPGIPVWYTNEEAKFARLPYIIFPGNVGTVDDLHDIVEMLTL